MNRFKLDAIREEFSCVAYLTMDKEATDVDSVEVKRVDANLLNTTPSYSGATGSMVGIDEGEKFHFVLEDGTVLEDAVKNEGSCHHNEAHWDNESWTGETVLEAIEKHGVGDTIVLIVQERYGHEIQDHYSIGGLDFIVYKAPKGKTIADYLEEARVKAMETVKAEVNF